MIYGSGLRGATNMHVKNTQAHHTCSQGSVIMAGCFICDVPLWEVKVALLGASALQSESCHNKAVCVCAPVCVYVSVCVCVCVKERERGRALRGTLIRVFRLRKNPRHNTTTQTDRDTETHTVCLSLSLSVAHTHTHTHTHTLGETVTVNWKQRNYQSTCMDDSDWDLQWCSCD